MRTEAVHTPGVASVAVHAPPGWDAHAPLHLVVFLHGVGAGCAWMLAASERVRCRPQDPPIWGMGYGWLHDQAGVNALFVVPQFAFNQMRPDAGRFARPGAFRAFLEELLRDTLAARLGGPRTLAEVGSLTLVAHSGGGAAAQAIVRAGDVDDLLRNVVLFDALYGRADGFAAWLRRATPDRVRRLVSLHTGGAPATNDAVLVQQLRRHTPRDVLAFDPDAVEAQVAHAAAVVGHAHAGHFEMLTRYYVRIVRALGLPPR
jgi:hypothetical protein